jgi:hypothetical protein
MGAKTSLILVTGVGLGAALATRRFLSLLGVISGRSLWGYGTSLKRPQVAAENLLKRRTTAEEQSEAARELLGRLVKTDQGQVRPGCRPRPERTTGGRHPDHLRWR